LKVDPLYSFYEAFLVLHEGDYCELEGSESYGEVLFYGIAEEIELR
jgi:hypothetical protein